MALRVHLLGRPHFERDGSTLEITSNKAVALFAYLISAQGNQSRERILALLWPDSSEEAARKNLRNTLWLIRRTFGEGVIEANGESLYLAGPLWCDVRELSAHEDSPEQLQPPLTEWQVGDFLDSIDLDDAPDYEIWLARAREQYRQMYLHATMVLIERHRTRGDWKYVLSAAQTALALDALQESFYRLEMEAYAQLGQRAEALHAYDTLSRMLRSEIGVEPLPQTEALRSSIMAGTYPAQITADILLQRHTRRKPILGDNPQPPFVGRATEMAALDSAFRITQSGHLQLLVLTGEMGIGKTRLWQEWSASLPPEDAALEARCLEATQTLPFAPLIQLFSDRAWLQRMIDQLPHPIPLWLAELARVIPTLQTLLPNLPAPTPLPLDEERRRLFEAFVQLVLNISPHPILIFIDDIHWADNATLDWLAYLMRRVSDQPVLVVLSCRSEDAPASLVHLLTNWERESYMTRLPLQRFTNEEAATLVSRLGGNPQLAQRVQAASAGNPLFLTELVRGAPDDVPPVLSELIRARLNHVSPTARQVLQAAAVLEQDIDYLTLRRASGRDEEETLDALDELMEASVLVERGGIYTFTHPLVAKVVRDSLGSARKVFLHRRAAEALAAIHAGRLEPKAAQLSHHHEVAGEFAKAAMYADLAAQHALSLAASADAIELYRRALTLDPSPERELHLGMALSRASEFNLARKAFLHALKVSIEQNNMRNAAEACVQMAHLSLASGSFDDTVRWANESNRYAGADAEDGLQVQAEFLLGAGLLQGGESLEEAEVHLRRAAQLATDGKLNEMAGQSRFELGNLLAQRGDLAQALEAYGESIQIAQGAGDTLQVILGHNNYAYHALLIGDLAAAHAHSESALSLADASAIEMPRQYLYSTRGEIAMLEGHWDESTDWFTRGMTESEKTGNRVQLANYRANLGLVAQGRGQLDDALLQLERAWQDLDSLQAPYLQTQIDLWLAELHLRRNENVAAWQCIQRAEDRMRSRGYHRLEEIASRLKQRANPN